MMTKPGLSWLSKLLYVFSMSEMCRETTASNWNNSNGFSRYKTRDEKLPRCDDSVSSV